MVDCFDSGGGVGHRVVVDPVHASLSLDRRDARVDVRGCKEGQTLKLLQTMIEYGT